MAFHFAKLTLSNGKPVYVNGDLVAAIYQRNNDTLVQFVGQDYNYIYVKETVEMVDKLIYEAMRYE